MAKKIVLKKHQLFDKLMGGVESMQQEREGKITLPEFIILSSLGVFIKKAPCRFDSKPCTIFNINNLQHISLVKSPLNFWHKFK